MSEVTFQNYSAAARDDTLSDTEKAGRYSFQGRAERRILSDLLGKLDLQPADDLLEIGCGTGNLIIPLSHFVARAVGIDNQAAIDRLQTRAPLASNLEGIAGDFLTQQMPAGKFAKILVYSVLHCLSSEDEAMLLIDRALSLLAPGGKLLLGDLPNQDHKRRFCASDLGQQTTRQWQESIATSGHHVFEAMPADTRLISINDRIIMKFIVHIRARGFEAYLLPQDEQLPFGHTREDILVTAHS